MLGTSDDWSMSHLFQRTTKPAYYIVDCQILVSYFKYFAKVKWTPISVHFQKTDVFHLKPSSALFSSLDFPFWVYLLPPSFLF